MKERDVLDFFCGAGGFSEGFRLAGFKVVSGYDHWRPACLTFAHNQGVDALQVDLLARSQDEKWIEALPNTTVILGSPPCISFSTSNKSGKADKEMGIMLLRAYLRIVAIKKHQPESRLKAWLLENVPNSKTFLERTYSFRDLALTTWAKRASIDPDAEAICLVGKGAILNAAEFGAPQFRKRYFCGELVASGVFPLPSPTHGTDLLRYATLGDIRQHMPSPAHSPKELELIDPLHPEISLPEKVLTDHFYDSGVYQVDWQKAKYLKVNHPYMGRMSFPEREDMPSRTILATKSATTREALIYKSEYSRTGDGEYRVPTIREAATLMGYPIDYQFYGLESTKWRLIGNAVCPLVSKSLAATIASALKLRVDSTTERVHTVDSRFCNLNRAGQKLFNDPPKPKPNSRFRRHPFKDGNMAVTLTNYHPESGLLTPNRKWYSSVFMSSGDFKLKLLPVGSFKRIRGIVEEHYPEVASKFFPEVDRMLKVRLADAHTLQEIYTRARQSNGLWGPTELIDKISDLISIHAQQELWTQNGSRIIDKDKVPLKQLLAMYAINKIASDSSKHQRD